MSRVQLALNVSDLDEAVDFYSKLFGTEPAKRRPGYANFAIADPPLKLVLIEDADARGSGVVGALNHLGVEVETTDEVRGGHRPARDEGSTPTVEEQTTCCFAVQDKVWVNDPDGAPGRSTPCWPTHRPRPASPVTARAASLRRSAAARVRGRRSSGPRPAAERVAELDELGRTGSDVRDTILWRRLLAEFLGSAFLAAIVIGSGIAAQQLSPATSASSSSRTPRPPRRGCSPSS